MLSTNIAMAKAPFFLVKDGQHACFWVETVSFLRGGTGIGDFLVGIGGNVTQISCQEY